MLRRSLIHVMQDFHRYKDLHRVKVASVKWLDSDWQELQSYSCNSLDANGKTVAEVASDVVTRVNFTSLSTTIAVGSGRNAGATFPITEVLRRLPGNFRLNDTVVHCQCRRCASSTEGRSSWAPLHRFNQLEDPQRQLGIHRGAMQHCECSLDSHSDQYGDFEGVRV